MTTPMLIDTVPVGPFASKAYLVEVLREAR